jgi:hypothetical protein
MTNALSHPQSINHPSIKSIVIWRILQTVFWLVGAAILFFLLFYPAVGIIFFWNILIPVAPALLVIAIGLWRNVCPLATTALLPRKLNLSKKKKLTVKQTAKLNLIALIALYLIVPLRHALLNTSGLATAMMLIVAVIVAISVGFFYDWKTAWCSGLCPIHPVEKLYGARSLMSFPNAHCGLCVNCTTPCPDSSPDVHLTFKAKSIYQKVYGLLLVGGFPGFVWGWFHIADNRGILGFAQLLKMYTVPIGCMLLTAFLYWSLTKILTLKNEKMLINIFAASAVSCYYWFRLPALLGFGKFTGDGVLIDLSGTIPAWLIQCIIVAITVFFFSWMVLPLRKSVSWLYRPENAKLARG